MKLCCKCKTEKDLSQFYKRASAKDGYYSQCKPCSNKVNVSSMKRKPGKYAAIRRKTADMARDRYHQYKREKGCACCSEGEPVCLELHHLDVNEKELHPSRLGRGNWERFLTEAEKCIVVCSNCHKKIHARLIVTTKDGKPVIIENSPL